MDEKKEIHLGGTKIVFTDEALYFFDATGYGDSGNMPLDDIVSVLVRKPGFKSGKGSGGECLFLGFSWFFLVE